MRKIWLLILVLCVLLLAACNPLANIKTPEQDKMMTEILKSVKQGDYDNIRSYFVDEISGEDFQPGMKSIGVYVKGDIENIEKAGYYVRGRLENGRKIQSQELTYRVVTTEDQFLVTMFLVSTDGKDYKISGINAILESEYASDGAVIDFNNFDIRQLLLLIYSALCIGFVIFTIVVCAKSKIRLKALWIIIIILLQTGVSIKSSAYEFRFNFHLFFTNISSLRKYLDGGTVLTVLVPLGAILFLALRKRLIAGAERYDMQKAKQSEFKEEEVKTELNE